MPNTPPQLPDRLLRFFLPDDQLEEVLGDLHEEYRWQVNRVGKRQARWQYWLNTIGFLKPWVVRRTINKYPTPTNTTMLRNYFKIAFRNLAQSKGYSALTIFGLALGLAVSLLSILYVTDELSYDRYNEKADRIYRINSDISFSLKGIQTARSPTPMGQTLKRDFPEVEEATRLGKYGSHLVKSDHTIIRENGVLYADSTVFDVFTLPMLAGNPKKALTEPQSVVLTEHTAKKYFGTTDALNRVLVFDDNDIRRVTGIIEDIPAQSHVQADFLLPLHETNDAKVNKWGNHIFSTYVVLRPGTKPELVNAKFEHILQTYVDPALRRYFNTSLAETRKAGNYFNYSLLPLTDIHLHSDRDGELSPNNSIEYVYLFLVIALFILLIAVFNFINLTTARSAKRAREVGVRKVAGSTRAELILQFLSESLLTTFFALLVGIGLVYFLLPIFNRLSAKNLAFNQLIETPSIFYLLVGAGSVGILAGLYPALYLSSFKPITVLKGKLWVMPGRHNLRNYLVVFQFSLSVLLIIGTLLINQQMQYIQNKKLGFNKEQVVVINTAQSTEQEVITFKQEVLRSPAIKTGTVSGFLPVASNRWNDMWYPENTTDQKQSVGMQEWQVDPDYIATLGMQLLKGRNFIAGRLADKQAVIINESAAKRFGYQNPVGKSIHLTGGEQLTIIGVVKDFHYESLRNTIEPVGLVVDAGVLGGHSELYLSDVSFRLNTADVASALATIEKTWKQIAPDRPFAYSFLSDDFDAMYRAEQRTEQLFMAFAAIAILIACLGLFGLSAFAAEQRQKEIGVRKVLGASIPAIVALLSKDFLKPVLIAIVIASPIAWWATHTWLQDFAYKVDIAWWVFALAGILSIGIALLTVSFQSIKAALMNPVKSLRSE
ncbi:MULTISPECIES: ABC transporter permease [unclassified Spirosoma]|uniref:ABC transporter permease n=1 Tax=unclassified Spirosoma TaxID=2621999 RepID=UPI000AB27144|nr:MULTISPECIES: ABC transporter permease [unclassified Spirosoma]